MISLQVGLRMTKRQDSITEFIDQYPEVVLSLARRLRDLIRRMVPDADEELDRPARVIGYSYGPGYKGVICTIILSKTGVKLGIVDGAHMADPANLLEGSGKQHRYVLFRHASDFDRSGICELVDATAARCRERCREKA